MTTLSKNAIYCICLTTDIVSERVENEIFYRFIKIGIGLAIRCLNADKPEDAQRTILKANVMMRETLARQGITAEDITKFLQTQEVAFAIRVGLAAVGADPAVVGKEIVDFTQEQMQILREQEGNVLPNMPAGEA
jgi:hypothetical protein